LARRKRPVLLERVSINAAFAKFVIKIAANALSSVAGMDVCWYDQSVF